MRTKHFTRKLRQLKYLSKQIKQLQITGAWAKQSQATKKQLSRKLKQRYEALLGLVSPKKLQRILAGLAIAMGLTIGSLQAQNTFADKVVNPFGLVATNPLSWNEKFDLIDLDGDGDLDFYTRHNFHENVGTPEYPLFAAPTTHTLDYHGGKSCADIDSNHICGR